MGYLGYVRWFMKGINLGEYDLKNIYLIFMLYQVFYESIWNVGFERKKIRQIFFKIIFEKFV